jgi:LacI family transcriptional regulator, galactose operon repressor
MHLVGKKSRRSSRPHPPRRRPRREVALLIETSNGYARGLLNGIIAYIREHESWSVYLGEHGRGEDPPHWLRRWRGDGVIARIENQRIASAVVESGLPAVDVSAARKVARLPWVETDDRAIADAGARHLLDRNFRHLAFCGDDQFNWSRWRCEHFQRIAAEAGVPCSIYRPSARARRDWNTTEDEIGQWLLSLPRPVGVMACYDIRARHVLDACRRVGLAVPDQVAVVGVDNDEFLCNLSDPPLSSIAPDTRRTGYEAAALLDRLMSGRERRRGQAIFVQPLGVVTRRSTDVLAVGDADVSAAVHFIREHACDGIAVKDLLHQVPLSRRVLEGRFRKLLGRTPHDEIARVRFDRVQRLLRETRLPLADIARQSGFRNAEYLATSFRREFGMSPNSYRTSAGLTFSE